MTKRATVALACPRCGCQLDATGELAGEYTYAAECPNCGYRGEYGDTMTCQDGESYQRADATRTIDALESFFGPAYKAFSCGQPVTFDSATACALATSLRDAIELLKRFVVAP